MGIRSRVARGALAAALLASTIGVTLALSESPASAAAPAVDLFSPGTITLTQQDGEQAARTNHIYAMAIVRHDPGTNVNGVRFDLVHGASGGTYGGTNCSTTGSATCSGGYVSGSANWQNGGTNANASITVRELPGQASATTNTNSNYSQVWIDIKPRNGNSWQNDGPDGSNNGVCGLEGGGPRLCKNTASFSFRTSDGQTTSDQTMTYWTVGENDGSGEDFPAVYATTSTNHTQVTAGAAGAVTIGYTCDDNDGGGGNSCDSARVRFRRAGDNATVRPGTDSDASGNLICAQAAGSPDCETRTNNGNYVVGLFNADDNTARSYTYRAPRSRGLYYIEASFCNDDGLCPHGTVPSTSPAWGDTTSFLGQTGTMWQNLGSFYVNESAPTVSFGTTTQTGGSTVNVHPSTNALHPNTGATVTFNATTSGDVQVIDWNTDQNNSNGINSSGYESRTYGTMSYASSPGTPTVVKTRDVDLSGYAANANCGAAVRVYDSGGVNATDITSSSASATRTCTTNNLPAGTAQSGINVQRGQSVNLALAASDADRWTGASGGDESPTISITQPAVGTVTCGSFSVATASLGSYPCGYSVPANATPGAFSFSYTITDSHAGTSPAVTVTGTIGNTAPTATGGSRTIPRGTSSVFNLNGSDPTNGDTIDGSIANTGYATVSTAGMPGGSSTNCTAAGACTVAIAAGTTPGASSFTWNVKDNNATSGNATETITITNAAPAASPLTKNDVQRGRPGSESTLQLVGTDAVNNDPLTYSVVSTAGMPAGSDVSCTSGGACEISVPSDTALGNYSFTYKANDNDLDSNTATVTVGVGNTTPVANPVGVLHTTVGAPLSTVLDGTDFNGDTLTYDAPVTAPGKGGVTGSGANRTYTAADGTKGADSFTYTVSDNAPSTSTAGTVSIQIDNTAPAADGQSVSAVRQVEESFQLTGSDVNADDLTYAVQATTTKGVLACDSNGACTYTAGIGQTGTDSFTFVTNDGSANSTEATVTITITNSSPAGTDQAVDAPREVATNLQLTGTDPNGDDLTFSGPTTGPAKGEVTCDSAGACTYTSDPGETGTDSFTFTVTDIEGATGTGTVTLTLTNSAPTATDQSLDAQREVATPISLAGTDPNNDALTFAVADQPTKGLVSCDPDGSCTYTSGAGETGTDSFTFTADDGNGATETGTVTITLTNTAPTANSASYNVTQNIPKSFVLSGTDLNNDPLTYAIDTYPTMGSVGCTANVCTYTATSPTGADSFTFTATDPEGATHTGTISFIIGPPRLTLADSQVLEPEPGQPTMGVMVPVTLSSPIPSPVTISYYTTDGTATGGATGTSGGDYRIWGTPAKPRTQTIPAGATWDVISPIIHSDTISEPTETFEIHVVSATAANGAPIALGDPVANVDVIDNYNNTGDPLLVLNDTWTYESDNTSTQKGQISVQLSKPSTVPIILSIQYSNGTATQGTAGTGSDFRKGSVVKLTFLPGQFQKTLDFSIWGDTVLEDHETFTIQAIPTVDSGPVVQQKPIATVVLLNDD